MGKKNRGKKKGKKIQSGNIMRNIVRESNRKRFSGL